jgi:hypothetical protein
VDSGEEERMNPQSEPSCPFARLRSNGRSIAETV